MEYLKVVHPWLASWYTYLMILILTSWSAVQSKTLAQVYAQEGVPEWVMGLIVVAVTSFVLLGGSQRVGLVASRIVPFMFVFYVTFALIFLLQDLPAVWSAIQLVLHSAFTPAAAMGGFAGASVYQAVRFGLYKGVFITEAGMGTSSIPHAVANTKNPTDQGILAMFSMISDAFLSMLSGLLVLSTGIWMQGEFRTTLLYEVFKMKSPMLGSIVLLITISLFVGTTIIGNTYNGRQVFASITGFRWVNWYVAFTMCMMFIATIANARDVWTMVDFLTPFAAIPNLIGLVILSFKYPAVLQVSDEK
jgi:AGCS family alanine or glycine:cation symporter